LFPRTSGRSLWLIDAPSEQVDAVTRALTTGLARYGMQVTPTRQRLAELAAVQNTYISAFQLLGGLGLVLGTLGVAALVLRHVLERRRELALLQALGFPTATIAGMMLAEHLALVVGGVLVGTVAAALAVWPQLHGPTAAAIAGSLLRVAGVVVLTGLAATGAAVALALRGRLLPALRSE
jgi:ABC-type antimicrobial peptide transport system permease subunit